MGYHLIVVGEDGEELAIEQGKGLGIRAHDDVMLSWGLSKKTWLEKTIPVGHTAVIKVIVPEQIRFHHAEARTIETKDAPIRVRVLSEAVSAQFPAVVQTMPIDNDIEGGTELNLTIFQYCGTVLTANVPATGVETSNFPLWAVEGQGSRASTPASSTSPAGRYSSPGTKAVLITNLGTVPTTFFYQYNYHEK